MVTSSIKFSIQSNKFNTLVDSFFGKFSARDVFICFTHFYHKFTTFLFDNQVRKKSWTQIIQNHTSCIPCINWFMFRVIFPIRTFSRSSIGGIKIINQLPASIINFNSGMELISRSISTLFNVTHVKTAFSINYSSKIRNFWFGMIRLENSNLSHKDSLKLNVINYASILNEINYFVHGERLSLRDRLNSVCDSLDSMDNIERETRSGIPASKMVSSLLLGDESNRTVLNQAALRLGVSLRQTEDELVRNMLASTATQINSFGGPNGDNPTELTVPAIGTMTQVLLSNNGYMFTSTIEGQDKFGSSPVRNAYLALCNTDLTNSLNSLIGQGFTPQSNYPSQQYVLESEWGAVNNMRFLVSSIGSVSPNASGNNADVYNIICAAKEAYACIKQDGATAQFIYRPAYLSGPLAQNVTVGWKMATVPRILNDAWVGNLRCTLPTI